MKTDFGNTTPTNQSNKNKNPEQESTKITEHFPKEEQTWISWRHQALHRQILNVTIKI
jgi:hypothetical protein